MENFFIKKIKDIENEENIYICGIVKDVKITQRKSDGQELAFFAIESEDGYDAMDCRCFTEVYKKYKHLIKENKRILINGDCYLENITEAYYVFNMKNGMAI